jgi:DNA-binding transcriptional MerR regulator
MLLRIGAGIVALEQSSENSRSLGGPPDKKLFSVGEVVKLAGISRQVLHNYTVLGLLRPAERTATNRRYYDESTFRRIELIRRQLKSGYTLQSLRELFPWEE